MLEDPCFVLVKYGHNVLMWKEATTHVTSDNCTILKSSAHSLFHPWLQFVKSNATELQPP